MTNKCIGFTNAPSEIFYIYYEKNVVHVRANGRFVGKTVEFYEDDVLIASGELTDETRITDGVYNESFIVTSDPNYFDSAKAYRAVANGEDIPFWRTDEYSVICSNLPSDFWVCMSMNEQVIALSSADGSLSISQTTTKTVKKYDTKLVPDELISSKIARKTDVAKATKKANEAYNYADAVYWIANNAQTTADNAQTAADNVQTAADNAWNTAHRVGVLKVEKAIASQQVDSVYYTRVFLPQSPFEQGEALSFNPDEGKISTYKEASINLSLGWTTFKYFGNLALLKGVQASNLQSLIGTTYGVAGWKEAIPDTGEPYLITNHNGSTSFFSRTSDVTVGLYKIDYKQLSDSLIPDTIQRVGNDVIVNSSTPNSTKKFKITVDDTGTLSATEVTT